MGTTEGISYQDACDYFDNILKGHYYKMMALSEVNDKGQYSFVVELNEEEMKIVDKFVSEVVEKKIEEGGEYVADGEALHKRFKTGIMGEMAVMKMLGVDLKYLETEVGETKEFKHADLKGIGINAGVKTVCKGMTPLVYEDHWESEFFCMRDEKEGKERIIVLGVGSKEVINQHSNKLFVKNKDAYNNKSFVRRKCGFYGLGYLDIVSNIEEISELGYVKVDREKFDKALA